MNREIKIKQINKDKAINFIQKYHYSNIMPRLTKHYLGFYVKKELFGVVTLGWGTQPLQTIKKIFYNHNFITTDYIEIGKMCFLPKMNNTKSFGSMTISILIKWLKDNTNYKFLYTLADGIMGKCGYVYQASNFIYIGKFQTQVYLDKNTLEKIHPRSAKKLCIENAKYENKEKVFWLTDKFCNYKNIDKIVGLMFRYIYPLSKKYRKIILSYSEYLNTTYPKDKDLIFKRRVEKGKYELIAQPNFNMEILEYNYQRKKNNMQTDIFDFI